MLLKQKLPQKDLEKILSTYDLGQISNVEPLATSGNITYVIDAEKGKFIFRLCPTGPRYRSKEEVAAELELIDYLLKNNFPAPVPLAKNNGDSIIGWKGKYGYLRKFDDGEEVADPSVHQIELFGETLGWFHNLTENFHPQNQRKHIFNLPETLKHFKMNRNLILKSKFNKAQEFVEKVEIELSRMDFPENLPSGILHEDLGKRHVLWKDGKVSSIVDFDRSYYGPLILDLGQSIRGWCFVDNWTKWSNENFKALISGYQSKRKLTNLEKEKLFDAIKFGILERGISFCIRYIIVTNDPEDEDFAYKSAFDFLDVLSYNIEEIQKVLTI